MRWTLVLVIGAVLLTSTAAWAKPCKEGDDTEDDCKEYEAFMAPGATALVYAPEGAKGQPFVGGGVQIAPVQWSHNNNDYGPSQGSIFFQASILTSASSTKAMALYEGGITLSFERNANRHFAIPYFGFTTGGVYNTGFKDSGYIYPLAGMHVFSHPNVVVDVQGGYMLPFEAVDELRGFRAQASIRLHMW